MRVTTKNYVYCKANELQGVINEFKIESGDRKTIVTYKNEVNILPLPFNVIYIRRNNLLREYQVLLNSYFN